MENGLQKFILINTKFCQLQRTSIASLYWTDRLIGTLIWPVCRTLFIPYPSSRIILDPIRSSSQLVLMLCLSYSVSAGISWHEFIEFLSASWCTQNLPHIITFSISHFHTSFHLLFVTCMMLLFVWGKKLIQLNCKTIAAAIIVGCRLDFCKSLLVTHPFQIWLAFSVSRIRLL